MKIRIIVSVFLLLVAIGLPVIAVVLKGPPWGFRGHAAVVVEATGNVEGVRPAGAGQQDEAALNLAPNARLDVGDEIRVGRFSEVRVRFPGASLVLGDGARAVIRHEGITLVRGLLVLRLPHDTKKFAVLLDGDAELTARPGVAGAELRVVADGKGGVQALVADGSAELSAKGGDALGETGRLLVLGSDQKPTTTSKPGALDVSATCNAGKLNVVAPPQTEIFAGGTLTYPDAIPGAPTGSAIIAVDPKTSEVKLFARDPSGNALSKVVPCDKKG